MSTTNCSICVEKYNHTKNKPIACLYCKFEACKKCCETYILGETVDKCMNTTCGKSWPRKFMVDHFTVSFMNGPLKNHKKNLLFERERGLLPATQPVVEEEIRREKILEALAKIKIEEGEETFELRQSYNIKKQELDDIICTKKEQLERYNILKKELKEIKKKINEIWYYYEPIRDSIRAQFGVQQDGEDAVTRRTFVRACPDEDCRGYLSTQWKCGLCEKWACPDCHLVKGPVRDCDHTCNPDDVATAKLLASDTKPCPNCRTGIFKINGCDQMFCTQCHTGFSWNTGKIETQMHNPHYFEWMRRNQEAGIGGEAQAERNPLEAVCGREIDHWFINDMIRHSKSVPKDIHDKAINIARSIIELNQEIIPQYIVDDILNNQPLRVKYMRGKITEEAFQTYLLKNFKEYEKKKEYRDVLVMFKNTAIDILYRFRHSFNLTGGTVVAQREIILNEIDALVLYVNESLLSIAKNYSFTEHVLKYNMRYSYLSFKKNIKKKRNTENNGGAEDLPILVCMVDR